MSHCPICLSENVGVFRWCKSCIERRGWYAYARWLQYTLDRTETDLAREIERNAELTYGETFETKERASRTVEPDDPFAYRWRFLDKGFRP